MQKVYNRLTDTFRKQNGVISSSTFQKIVYNLDDDLNTIFYITSKPLGLPNKGRFGKKRIY